MKHSLKCFNSYKTLKALTVAVLMQPQALVAVTLAIGAAIVAVLNNPGFNWIVVTTMQIYNRVTNPSYMGICSEQDLGQNLQS